MAGDAGSPVRRAAGLGRVGAGPAVSTRATYARSGSDVHQINRTDGFVVRSMPILPDRVSAPLWHLLILTQPQALKRNDFKHVIDLQHGAGWRHGQQTGPCLVTKSAP
jgi:hypothetical protein